MYTLLTLNVRQLYIVLVYYNCFFKHFTELKTTNCEFVLLYRMLVMDVFGPKATLVVVVVVVVVVVFVISSLKIPKAFFLHYPQIYRLRLLK